MRRALLITTLMTTLGTAGWVAAETAAPAPKPHHEAAAPAQATPGHDTMGGGTMGGGMMGGGAGHGMMGGGMMGGGMMGMCPTMLGGADAAVAVKNIDKGVTITITSNDPAAAKRVQKMAEAMRLMHEAMGQ